MKGGAKGAAAVAVGVARGAEPRALARGLGAPAAAAAATAATGVRGCRMEEVARKKCVAVVAAGGLSSSMDLRRVPGPSKVQAARSPRAREAC